MSSATQPLEPASAALPGERRVLTAAERSLSGETRGLRALVPFLGPAFVAAVAYVDPGNFATNIAGGAAYGYRLLWVVLAANLMAMLVQAMSAKLGAKVPRTTILEAVLTRGLDGLEPEYGIGKGKR